MKVYIISYFGPRDFPEVREVRKQTHKEQVEWFTQRGHTPVVLHQDYDTEDFVEGVSYVGDNSVMTASEARNYLFDVFYNTDDDFACFADNDTIYKDIFDYDILSKVEENSDRLVSQVDLLFALNPITFPFNKDIRENQDQFNNYFCFRKTDNFKESLFVMANLNKIRGCKEYFEVDMFRDDHGRMIAGEGTDFVLKLLSKGLVALQFKQLVLHEKDTKSTWNSEKDQERYRIPTYIRQYWIDRYNIPVTDLNAKRYMYVGYAVNEKGKVTYHKCANHGAAKKLRDNKKYAKTVVHQLPVSMNNEEIAGYLDISEDIDETLSSFPRDKLLKEISIRRDLTNLYKHIDFDSVNNISFVRMNRRSMT